LLGWMLGSLPAAVNRPARSIEGRRPLITSLASRSAFPGVLPELGHAEAAAAAGRHDGRDKVGFRCTDGTTDIGRALRGKFRPFLAMWHTTPGYTRRRAQ